MFTESWNDFVSGKIAPRDGHMLFRFASKGPDQDQDEANTCANGDYSDIGLGATDFILQPPADEVWAVANMVIVYFDTQDFRTDRYGSGLQLVNGVVAYVYGDEIPIPGGVPITPRPVIRNGDWAIYADRIQMPEFIGGGPHVMAVTVDLISFGFSGLLRGFKNEGVRFHLNDDFSSLNCQYFMFKGLKAKSKGN